MIRAEKKLFLTGVYCGTCQNYTRGVKTAPTIKLVDGYLHKTHQCICVECGVTWQHTDVSKLEYDYTMSDEIEEAK